MRLSSASCVLGALLLVTVSSHAQAPPIPTGTSRVSGRILSSSSEPIEGALVGLALQSEPGRLWSASWTATTGVDGAYSFDNLPGGTFVVVAVKEGYAGWELLRIGSMAPDPRLLFWLATMASATRHSVELVPRGHASEINITLRRTGSISGVVRTGDGRLAVDTMVNLYPVDDDGRLTGFRSCCLTDVNGRYRIPDASPGSYFVGAGGTGGTAARLNEMDRDGLVRVTVLEGSALTDVDLNVTPPRTFSVSGRVADTLGVVPRSVQVEYGTPGASHRGILSVQSADGTFQIVDAQVKAGPVTLLARGQTDEGPLISLVTFVALEGPNEIEIVLGKPGALKGRVSTQGGVPFTSTGRLALVRDGFMPLGAGDDPIDVAPDGWFEAGNLLGEYRVRVDEPQGWTVKAVRRGGVRLANDRIIIRNGDSLDDMEIVIGPR